MKLIGKLIITAKIETITGLHIGGSKNTKRIGDIDNNVIKSAKGIPYIPGSSLKGKLRSMLTRKEGSIAISADDLKKDIDDIKSKIKDSKTPRSKLPVLEEYKQVLEEHLNNEKTDDKFTYLYQIFGSSGNEDSIYKTRLIIRDAYLDTDAFDAEFGDKKEYLDSDYSQSKFENVINRVSGTALHPRQIERVPAGAEFYFKMVYDNYDDNESENHLTKIANAMAMLQDDYIGGSGSRGYGEIKFNNVETQYKRITDEGYKPAEANNLTEIFDNIFNTEA